MPHRATHVLIVEDDEMVQSLLTAFLQESGYSVTAVGSAGAMWRILDTDRIDILLLDLGLPDEDGIAVARQFRASYETRIIVLTARTGYGDRLAALEIGADDYLVKPFHPREMTLRIENLLARSRGTPAQAQSESMALGSVRLNLEAHSLTMANGAEVCLTPSEYSVLVALARAQPGAKPRSPARCAGSHRRCAGGACHRRCRGPAAQEDRRRPQAPAGDQDRSGLRLPVSAGPELTEAGHRCDSRV